MFKNEIDMLDLAILRASTHHYKQRNKGGEPYMCHVMRVMLKCDSLKAKTVAIMHDLLEDCDYTVKNLRDDGFPDDIIGALILLNHNKDVDYLEYIKHLSSNELAVEVKIADLEDNSNCLRFPDSKNFDKWVDRKLVNYYKAYRFLKYGETCD